MAACLITVAGTGLVQINYIIGVTPYSVTTGEGTLYIEDTATDVTYTTLSGTAIASSLCLTINELAFNCFTWTWMGLETDDYLADAVILNNDDIIPIDDTTFPYSGLELADSINSLENEAIKITGYSTTYTSSLPRNEILYSYVVRTIGGSDVFLRIKNADDSAYIYIHGEVLVDCDLPLGYTAVDTCSPELILT